MEALLSVIHGMVGWWINKRKTRTFEIDLINAFTCVGG